MIEFKQIEISKIESLTDSLDSKTLGVSEKIVESVFTDGDNAVRRYAQQFDGLEEGDPLFLSKSDLKAAIDRIDGDNLELLERVAERIRNFAMEQRASFRDCRVAIDGGFASHRWLPLTVAGCYAPGGRYPLPSSVLMTAITARVAGVEQVWVATPKPDEIMRAAAAIAGADGMLVAGGAQAIAAMSRGLSPNMPRCDVIVGPGNRYVTAAKAIVSRSTRIDMLAGPSELVVIAGTDANPKLVAADLLAQAEHDLDAKPILIAFKQGFVESVISEITNQITNLPTSETAAAALANGGYIIAEDVQTAIKYCEQIAPEHLSLQGIEIEKQVTQFNTAAAVFVGGATAEVFGDYGAGPNHVLPTGGAARTQSGLSVATFMKMQTQLQITNMDLSRSMIEDAEKLGRLEGLIAHAESAAIRKKFVSPMVV